MELGYKKKTSKKFDETVARIEELTASKQFRVLHVHDVQATLAEKGLERGPMKIVEICSAKFAHRALGLNHDVGLFMPCKINVYTENGETVVSAMRPSMISEFFAEKELKELADEVDLLTRSNSDCKVILLATSNGAIFVNEVMKHLEDNPRVYSIQTSRLFWYRASTAQRSLLINDNGETTDVLSSGNIWSIIRENALRLPTTEKPPGGSGMIGDRFIKLPGHEYMWDLPGVRAEITSFLHTNFSSQ